MAFSVEAEPYAAVAEFVEIALSEAWTELDLQLAESLTRAPSDPHAAVVDIGAGGGRGVLAVGRSMPIGPIVAVEPSAPMRAVLLSRLALDPELLRGRTTVLPTDLAGADLPGRWSAALALNMLGHLEPTQRRRLWDMAADRLLPGAPLLITVQPPYTVTAIPEMDWGSVPVGRQSVVTSGRAEPDGPKSVVWHITYRVVEGRQVLREERMSHRWYVLDVAGLCAELDDAGLRAEAVGDRLICAVRR
ncbi:class I SAM-dependent methyltransferase [Pseudonocardia sichuanensis]|uniref:Methyltransferase family protein n=1 Tax=Pseudonocardia kunmingensis TaxID=630975 RepID=A0A543D9R0_9PSEU|nr:class I SAM-dependent methyltransferase [Pseudonocardia kunmingensis]TQM06071.1 hypothetical protein FB558_6306 [Pseudonocardia kunmingensis]